MKTVLKIFVATLLILAIIFVVLINIHHTIKVNVIYNWAITVTDSKIKLKGEIAASSVRYSGYKYQIHNGELLIRVYSKYASSIFMIGSGSLDVNIKGNFKDINRIYLVDDNNKKIIWDRNKTIK